MVKLLYYLKNLFLYSPHSPSSHCTHSDPCRTSSDPHRAHRGSCCARRGSRAVFVAQSLLVSLLILSCLSLCDALVLPRCVITFASRCASLTLIALCHHSCSHLSPRRSLTCGQDFLVPTEWFEDKSYPGYTIVQKFGGKLFSAEQDFSPSMLLLDTVWSLSFSASIEALLRRIFPVQRYNWKEKKLSKQMENYLKTNFSPITRWSYVGLILYKRAVDSGMQAAAV
ncbi:hypothetical protein VNO78_07891 [Psophocarpus tetragonolobus]|uniref:Homogentisate 1,2-dioxygenase N-terminal domain-containing protein n=1 Tax=Psophocarpus tetragonolobus TaxID=3891 RepID=A0AAN9XSG8_PSOTE